MNYNISNAHLLSIIAGAAMSLIVIGYKIGEMRGIPIPQIALLSMGAAAAFFGIRCWLHSKNAEWKQLPSGVWIWGAVAGLGAFAAIKLMGVALQLGPVTPVSCALMFGFVPVIIYSSLRYGEEISFWQYLSLTAALGAVIAAASGRGNPGISVDSLWQTGIYGLLLLGILITNSLASIGLKTMAMKGARASPIQVPFLFMTYFILAAASSLDIMAVSHASTLYYEWCLLGLMVASGSILAMICLSAAARHPATVVFPVSSVSCIMASGTIAAIFLDEQTGTAWYATMALAFASIVASAFPQAYSCKLSMISRSRGQMLAEQNNKS